MVATSGILQARARFAGPDHHELVVRYENDAEYAFRVREQALDGTLVSITNGAPEMTLRTNPRSPVADGDTIEGTFVDDDVVTVRVRFDQLPADTTHFQLDIVRDGWRTTFAAGTIIKKGLVQ